MSTPAASQQLLLGGDERERLARGGRAPGGELRLAERDHVLGERQPLDELAAAASDRRRRAAPGRASRPGGRGTSASACAERAPSGGAPPAPPLELPQQRADVGAVLRRRAAGGDGEAHRLDGAGEVAAQLAQVGDAGVAGEVRLAVDHRLQLALGVVVAAELDERVDADRRADRARRARPSASARRKSWRASASSPAVASASGVRGVPRTPSARA